MESAAPPDYTNWTNADLIHRVTSLESQLRVQNLAHSNHTTPQPFKKPKKAPKRFDASKYHTRLIALKFAYLGKRYNGFEHHSNNVTPLPTVEEELWKALMKTRLILPDFKDNKEDEVSWEGCEYSKCGRTDRGVSAFGQVIALRVRSNRPKKREEVDGVDGVDGAEDRPMPDADHQRDWDSVRDELPYIQLLNRVLPSDIRILAWCPDPGPTFSARFNCKERQYRYFFTNPAYAPTPSESRSGGKEGAWLDIAAMQQAAKKLKGLHDFRNMCKVDPSKQISDFRRRIFHATIKRLEPDQQDGAFLQRNPFVEGKRMGNGTVFPAAFPELYYFEVRGSAFLWHQVRHMMAVLFLVGQGFETPSVVDDLLDIQKTPAKPVYEMAADTPLVLWNCVFPNTEIERNDHGHSANPGYEDALDWHHIGDDVGDSFASTRSSAGTEDRKYGRMGIMEDVWATWQTCKLDELLAGSLMDVIARQGKDGQQVSVSESPHFADSTARVFDGSNTPRTVGRYVPLVQRERLDAPDVLNARYAIRKGLTPKQHLNGNAVDADE